MLTAADWPAWRGPAGLGVSREENVPAHWTKKDNVRWRTPLPEPGNSTPIVWGNKVFLTQAIEKESRRNLMCFDRGSGKLLWQNGLLLKDPDPTHKTNPHASASPVTDGERVIAWFGQAGIAAYDFSGKELWRRDLGAQQHVWGYGTSPVLHGGRVFLNFGPGERSFLIALDKKTGKTLWQVDFPSGTGVKFNNWDPKDMYGTWSTPLLVRAVDREELIVSVPRRVIAYDPATGNVLWSCEGLGDLVYASPVVSEENVSEPVVVAMSGFGGPALAVKAGGAGDVTATR
ncbi:MAG: PQQ-binding-like beta-propeller repeat protein, partial [Bryobacteraceae bacterium]